MGLVAQEMEITPLGAAVVEALPDQKLKSKIVRDFVKKKICPLSKIFQTARSVEQFYAARGQQIRATGFPFPSRSRKSNKITV